MHEKCIIKYRHLLMINSNNAKVNSPLISVVVNTLNEASKISACIQSVDWADEVIVVDMMSEDQTVQVAHALGCTVYTHARMGYVEPAREFAVSKSHNDWVFVLDADETCSRELRDWISQNLPTLEADAVSIPRRNFMRGIWMRCCGWYPDRQLRLFRKSHATFSREIHQSPKINGRTFQIPSSSGACIEHAALFSMSDRLSKLAKYSDISARFAFEGGRSCNASMILLRTVWAFFSAYLLKGGIFAGSLGLVLSMERANSTFMKYLCLWDRSQIGNEHH